MDYMDYTEKKVRHLCDYKGVIIDVTLDQVQLPDGKLTVREVCRHPGGVAIVAIAEDGSTYCVRQYRYPFDRHVVEIPAGKLDWNEDPLDCARRELSEETGLEADSWQALGYLLVSPGISSEKLYLYLATDLRQGDAHPDEGEYVEILKMPFSELYKQVLSGEVSDGKTVAAVLKTVCMTKEGKKFT